MATPAEVSSQISRSVARRLAHAGISQREAAARSGIPLATLSRRLTGHSPFLVTELAVLADLLGISVTDLASDSAGLDSTPGLSGVAVDQTTEAAS